MLCEVEGMSAADGCARSLGGIETPGALEVARIPGVCVPVCVVTSVVPVCVVSTCVYTSVEKCVLQRTHSAGERHCVRGATSVSAPPCVDETPCANETRVCTVKGVSATPCASGVVAGVPECVLPSTPCVKGAPQVEKTTCAQETARVCEQPCGSKARCMSETPRVSAPAGVSEARCVTERPNVRRTACVRSLCVREMSVAMRKHAAASPGVNGSVMECSLGVVTRR